MPGFGFLGHYGPAREAPAKHGGAPQEQGDAWTSLEPKSRSDDVISYLRRGFKDLLSAEETDLQPLAMCFEAGAWSELAWERLES